ncbi:MAG: HAMP domain-containing protein, partial [Planctomycetes bacterium]|nr:HAMP domain-containing protein [Planctomycetota bacterium]
MDRSIRSKILAAQVSQVFAAILILGFSAYALINELHDKERLDHLHQVAQYNGRNMETFLAHKQGIMERIALSDRVENHGDASQVPDLIRYFKSYSSELPVLALVNQAGDEIVKVDDGILSAALDNIAHTQVFQRASNQPNTRVFAFPEAPVTSESVMEFAFARETLGRCVGIVYGQVPIQALSGQLVQSDEHSKSDALFVNGQGEILAHTDATMIGNRVPEATLQNAMLRRSRVTQRMDFLGQDCFVAMSAASEHGYTALVVCPSKVSLSAPFELKKRAVIILIVFMCVAYVVSVIMASNLSRPIMRLSGIAQQIASGDFRHRVSVKSDDEVGLLEQSFNDMLEHLEHSTTSIELLNQEIEQRKQAENRHAELLSQIEDTNNELKDFAHIVSHDLKAPLRGIHTVVSWLQEDYAHKLDESGREQLTLLTQRVDRMKNLIEGILQYSQVGRINEEITSLDLNKTLPEIIDLLMAPNHMTITICRPLPTVNYETTRLTQVFQNLLSNAIKFNDKPDGRIEIDYTEDESFWTFSLSDNGPGIEGKYFDRIFGIFQTLNPRDEYESTGIGLAVIKKTIEA